mgnify:CR=1 FL=1
MSTTTTVHSTTPSTLAFENSSPSDAQRMVCERTTCDKHEEEVVYDGLSKIGLSVMEKAVRKFHLINCIEDRLVSRAC